MFHEIILALQMRGSFSGEKATLNLMPSLEKKFSKQLIEMCKKYQTISNFLIAVEKSGLGPVNISDTILLPGMYLSYFCHGVNEILDEYHSVLLRIEKNILKDPSMSGATILNNLDPMFQSLDAIRIMIEKIVNQEVSGAQILEMCYAYTYNGTSPVACTFKRIQKYCHKVLLTQIKSWILYGNIIDPNKEFFIQKTDGCEGSVMVQSSVTLESMSTSRTTHVCPVDEEYVPVYKISIEHLPSVIPLSLATKILFIGETVRLFSKNPEEQNHDNIPVIDISKYGINQKNIINKLHEIGEMESFHIGSLEPIIYDVWLPVNRHLRKLAEDIGGLSTHLKLITDIYLLGRGELFQEFLSKANSILNAKAETASCRSLNLALENAAYYVYLSDNIDLLSKVSFIPPKEAIPKGIKTWSVLRLHCKTPWPLHLIFTNEVLSNYNMLFIFLLQLKKAHMDVAAVWVDVLDIHSDELKRRAMHVRNHLLSLITNLENYLYVDVIRSELEILENITKNTDTFSEIQKAHASFLSNIMSQTFLLSEEFTDLKDIESVDDILRIYKTSVFGCLKSLIIMCKEFAELIWNHRENYCFHALLYKFQNKLDRLIKQLISLVQDIHSNYSSSHLDSLILRLDYNGYFVKKVNFSAV